VESCSIPITIAPVLRFAREPGERDTMFFRDHVANPLEVEAFNGANRVFSH